MKYGRPLFTLISFVVVLMTILGVEQVYGVPLLYLGVGVLWLEKRDSWVQLIATVWLGSVLATVYGFAYSLGFIIIFGSILVYQFFRQRLASQTGALLFSAMLGSGVTGVSSGLNLSYALLLSSSLSFMLVILISKFTLTQPSKRYHL